MVRRVLLGAQRQYCTHDGVQRHFPTRLQTLLYVRHVQANARAERPEGLVFAHPLPTARLDR